MIRISLKQYAEPDYFQGWIYHNGAQLSVFFFSSADLGKLTDGTRYLNLFDCTKDTSQVLNLDGVEYDRETLSVIRKAQRLSPNFKRVLA